MTIVHKDHAIGFLLNDLMKEVLLERRARVEKTAPCEECKYENCLGSPRCKFLVNTLM